MDDLERLEALFRLYDVNVANREGLYRKILEQRYSGHNPAKGLINELAVQDRHGLQLAEQMAMIAIRMNEGDDLDPNTGE